MKKHIFYFSITIVSIFYFQTCTPSSSDASEKEKNTYTSKRVFSQYSEYTEKIIKSDSAVIRGLNLNVSKHIILQKETEKPFLNKDDTLAFKYQIDQHTWYTVRYTLHRDSLEEINVWIYSDNPDLSTQIFNELKDYYQQKLPNPIEDKGYVVYNCVQGERRPFVISISDFSTPTKGQINLVIYKDK